jgi:hypothetical protein
MSDKNEPKASAKKHNDSLKIEGALDDILK